jgi:hypothetical protein
MIRDTSPFQTSFEKQRQVFVQVRGKVMSLTARAALGCANKAASLAHKALASLGCASS